MLNGLFCRSVGVISPINSAGFAAPANKCKIGCQKENHHCTWYGYDTLLIFTINTHPVIFMKVS